jgi:hypothetical protein
VVTGIGERSQQSHEESIPHDCGIVYIWVDYCLGYVMVIIARRLKESLPWGLTMFKIRATMGYQSRRC